MAQLTTMIAWAVCCYFAYVLLSSIAHRIHCARAAKRLGAKFPPTASHYWWDAIGFFNFRQLVRNSSNKTLPNFSYDRYCRVSALQNRDCPTFAFTVLGRHLIFTADPKNVQAILATQFKSFELGSNRKRSFFPLLGRGIFTSDGKEWEHSRAMIRPSFVRDQVSDLDLEEKHCQNLMKALPVGHEGWTEKTDLQVLFYRLTIDSSTEFLFGQSVNSQLAEMSDASDKAKSEAVFAPAFDTAQRYLAARGRLGKAYWLSNNSEFRRSCALCHDFIDHYVQLALSKQRGDVEKSEKKYVFLEELASQTQDPVELRSQLLHILLAGRDTTASLLGWTFFLLARHPNVYQKLRQALLRDFGRYRSNQRGSITFSSLKNCQYLQYVLNETLRMFPVVPFNSRMATEDTTLPRGGGADGSEPIFVPKGVDIAYSVYVIHRRSALWGDDAHEFKPERWQGRRAGWEYLPFNGGPRICLGQQFALTSAGFAVTRLVQRFDRIENMDPHGMEDIRQNASITSCSDRGVQVLMHSIQQYGSTKQLRSTIQRLIAQISPLRPYHYPITALYVWAIDYDQM